MPVQHNTKLLIVDDLLLEHEFAMAILNVTMPGMDSFKLAKLMRSNEKTRHVPIVFVSATCK